MFWTQVIGHLSVMIWRKQLAHRSTVHVRSLSSRTLSFLVFTTLCLFLINYLSYLTSFENFSMGSLESLLKINKLFFFSKSATFPITLLKRGCSLFQPLLVLQFLWESLGLPSKLTFLQPHSRISYHLRFMKFNCSPIYIIHYCHTASIASRPYDYPGLF